MGLVALAILVLDRLTKILIVRTMTEFQSIPVIPGVFHLTYVRNAGAAFSLLPNRTTFFVIVSLAVAVAVAIFGPRFARLGPAWAVALGLVLGGTLGNLWDRMTSGLVIDFLDVRVWPVFNVADSSLVIGVIILSYLIIRYPIGQPGGGGGEK